MVIVINRICNKVDSVCKSVFSYICFTKIISNPFNVLLIVIGYDFVIL